MCMVQLWAKLQGACAAAVHSRARAVKTHVSMTCKPFAGSKALQDAAVARALKLSWEACRA